MKTKLAMGAVLLCGLAAVATEARAADRPAIGFRAGLSLASFHGGDVGEAADADDMLVSGPESLTGLCAGVFVAIPITDTLLFQPEALYSQKGATYTLFGEDLDLKLDYLEVPVLLKARFGTGAARPAVFAGPAIGFKLRAKGQFQDQTEDLDETKGTDFGLVFGAGVDLTAGSGAFVVDARYTLGLSTIDDASSDDLRADIKNKAFTLSIGYSF